MILNNCLSCGGKVEFSPKDNALKCNECGKIYDITFAKPKDKKVLDGCENLQDRSFEKWKNTQRTFQCKNCGAQIVFSGLDMSAKCTYCNTSALTPISDLPGLKPDAVIPFAIDKLDAKNNFKLVAKKKWFLPQKFKKQLPSVDVGSMYISAFSFDMDVFATYKGIRVVSRTVKTHNGTKTVYDHIPFSGKIQKYYQDVVVEQSSKINQDQINSILPYDFNNSYEYADDFIKGYGVEYYDRTVNDANIEAQKQVVDRLDTIIREKYGNVKSLTINPVFSNHKYNYVLLPIYSLAFKFKEKLYLNLMNGQTGQMSNKFPRSGIKITFFVLFILFLIIGLPLILCLLLS